MKSVDIVRRAGRSLRQAKARTILTSLAIAVGAFTLTLSIAAGEGSRQYADKLVGSNINPRSLVIVKDKELFGEGGMTNPTAQTVREYDPDVTQQRGVSIKQLTQEDIDKLARRDDLESVRPVYQLTTRYFEVDGSDKKFTAEVTTYDDTILTETAAGSLPKLGEQINDDEIVLPEAFAQSLVDSGVASNINEMVGKTLTLTIVKPTRQLTQEEATKIFKSEGAAGLARATQGETKEVPLKIRALTKKSSTALASGTSMLISSNQGREISEYTTKGTDNYQKYFAASALAIEGKDPEVVKQSLESGDYGAQTAEDLQGILFTIVNILQGIVTGFGVLALIASVFGIINTQYISVLERTQQIGLMKALGMRGRDVARLFRYEAAWIGFLGGLIGSLLAWISGFFLNPWITNTLGLGEGNYLLVFQLMPIVILVVSLMLVAVVAGYFPARKAAKLDPIEALRTE